MIATLVSGAFAIIAAVITGVMTGSSSHSASSTPGSRSDVDAAVRPSAAPATSPQASATPSPVEQWTDAHQEDMGQGGIDMDRWPEDLRGVVDVGPEHVPGNAYWSDFEASNGASVVEYGAVQPTPAQCRDRLSTGDSRSAALDRATYYCVTTSERNLVMFQVLAINAHSVSLNGYVLADRTTAS